MFTAAYITDCATCPNPVRPGDEATYVAFGEVAHVTCPPDPTALQRRVCGRCHLEVPVNGVCCE